MTNEAIGGYFELELHKGEHFHKYAICLNTARNCFEYILWARKYQKIYIPYYTCEVLLQPLKRLHVDYEFYSIGMDLEPLEVKHLEEGEAFLYTNYFGVKQSCVERMYKMYGMQLIVDNAQAFFAPKINGVDTFYSPRKYFGVADGGYLYTDCHLDMNFPLDKSYKRMNHLLVRMEDGSEAGYALFKSADDSLDNQQICRMSILTDSLLRNVDYASIRQQRLANFSFLHEKLGRSNRLTFEMADGDCPMVYPYYADSVSLRGKLIANKVYVAQYWPNVLEWCSSYDIEFELCQHILPLPIDQRYGKEEMERIVRLLI